MPRFRALGCLLLAALALFGALPTPAAAQPLLRCGATVTGSPPSGETDQYRLLARAGDAIRLRAVGFAQPSVVLLAPDLSEVSPTAPLPQTGVYLVEVGALTAGDYAFTLEAVSGSLAGAGNAWPPLACGGKGVPTARARSSAGYRTSTRPWSATPTPMPSSGRPATS